GIYLPAGETKSAFASRIDMAEATANVLAGHGHENKEYSLSNSESYSIREIAHDLSELVGKTIDYVSPSKDVYVETLTAAGVSPEYIGMFAGFAEAINQGEFSMEETDLEGLLGRKPMTAKAFLKETYLSS